MRIVDSHLHLVDRGLFSYPWLHDVPTLDRDWSARRLSGQSAGRRHQRFCACRGGTSPIKTWSAKPPGSEPVRLPSSGAVASCRPEKTGVRSLSRTPLGGAQAAWIAPDSAHFARRRRTASAFRREPPFAGTLPPDVRSLRIGAPAADRPPTWSDPAPTCSFILDHCGVPDVRGRVLDPWRTDLAAVAPPCPTWACKISGLVAYADPDGWSVDDLRPFVEHAIAVFGWDRVLWGSDWPVCTLTGRPRTLGCGDARAPGRHQRGREGRGLLSRKRRTPVSLDLTTVRQRIIRL